jgi:RNA polymerase primary sigma factor
MNYNKSESLSRYFKEIKDLNPLTKAEEIELAFKSQAGDRRAINKLVTHNLKIVITIANKNVIRDHNITVDDLIQQGNLGLYEAALRFKPEGNVRFASFAGTRVLKSMNQLIDTCGRTVRIPVNQEYKRYLDLKAGKDVDNISSVKLDKLVSESDDRTVGDLGILAVAPSIEEVFEHDHFKITTSSLLGKLSERDSKILKMYFGIDEIRPLSSADIADEVGLTQIRVCQIVNSAKKKLKTLV